MSILAPLCPEPEQWSLVDDRGRCPDCRETVPEESISDHVAWHIAVRRRFVGTDAIVDPVVELCGDGSGDLTQMAHDHQMALLRSPD